MKSNSLLTLYLFLILSVPIQGQEKPSEALQGLIERLDQTATELVKDPKAASFTLGLVERNGLVWTKSYGYADIEKRVPAGADSVYRVGSVTKQFTAIMLLQLVREGKVHLSDPVDKYFPEIHLVQSEFKNAPPITLLQLATHTSGLDTEPEDMWKWLKGPMSEWEKKLIAALPHTKYAYEPGTHFLYSNVGYAVLGLALSRAAHQPYTQYVKEKILLPLGMTHSGFEFTADVTRDLAIGYDVRKDGTFDTETPLQERTGRGYKVPNGGLYSTVGDLARFEAFEMLAGPENVLPKKELEENFQRITTTTQELAWGYGIGFSIRRSSGNVFVGHSGGTDGYIAVAFFQPASNIGIVMLRNESIGWADHQPRPDLGLDKLFQIFADHWK